MDAEIVWNPLPDKPTNYVRLMSAPAEEPHSGPGAGYILINALQFEKFCCRAAVWHVIGITRGMAHSQVKLNSTEAQSTPQKWKFYTSCEKVRSRI